MSGKYVGNTAIAARADLDALWNTTVTGIVTGQIATLQADVATLNTSLTTVNTDISTINTTLTTVQADLSGVETDIAGINATLATIAGEITAIDATLASIASEISTINGTLTSLQNQINALAAEIAAALTNPMTAQGDMIVGGTSPNGKAIRLPPGSLAQFLVMIGTPPVPTWITLNLGDVGGSPVPIPVKRVPYIYATAGSFSHTVTATCYAIEAEVWGAGGGTDFQGAGPYSVCGGAGGGYAWGRKAVSPGDVQSFVVGAAGVSAGGGTTDGGASTFNATELVANGGQNGYANQPAGGGTATGTLAGALFYVGQAGSFSLLSDTSHGSSSIGGAGAKGGPGAQIHWRGDGGPGVDRCEIPSVQPGGGACASAQGGGFSLDAADGMVIIWEYQ